jgi:hypothetical protein
MVHSTTLQIQAALLLVFLAARGVHLGQAAVNLSLAGTAYTPRGLAVALAVACLAESSLFALGALRRGRLTRCLLLFDALFGVVALGVMCVATRHAADRVGSLNWMLPYTVATCAGLGLVALGDDPTHHSRPPWQTAAPAGGLRRRVVAWFSMLWPPIMVVVLTIAYVLSVMLPHRVSGEGVGQILGNAAFYPVFFLAGLLVSGFLSNRLAVLAQRNDAVTRSAAQLVEEAQWRAILVDVFGPIIRLLDRIVAVSGSFPSEVRAEAERLIGLIEAVRPTEGSVAASRAARPGQEGE